MQVALSTALKAEALRTTGTLNPRPERVTNPLFQGSNFFDARDRMQIKYEMLRCVACEHFSVPSAALSFGFSRMAWYQVSARYAQCGLVGLLPQRRGPQPRPQKQRWQPVTARALLTGWTTLRVNVSAPLR